MIHFVVHSPLAPLYREPNPRSELVSQMVLGETGASAEERGDWISLRREQDGYVGWTHRGYLGPMDPEDWNRWRDQATGRSDGAVLRLRDARIITLPLLARVAPVGTMWGLPDGTRGTLVAGLVTSEAMTVTQARMMRAIDWAVHRFSGTPYLWGGLTPWGADCSGMVQTTFAARGIPLPRDSADQAKQGAAVDEKATQPDDLVFFGETPGRISHVAMVGDKDTLVHSTIACGSFVVEPWSEGHRAHRLRPQLQAIRRMSLD
ncbi:MAG: C40 family peptidase [Gemmatimonadota bacterium]